MKKFHIRVSHFRISIVIHTVSYDKNSHNLYQTKVHIFSWYFRLYMTSYDKNWQNSYNIHGSVIYDELRQKLTKLYNIHGYTRLYKTGYDKKLTKSTRFISYNVYVISRYFRLLTEIHNKKWLLIHIYDKIWVLKTIYYKNWQISHHFQGNFAIYNSFIQFS